MRIVILIAARRNLPQVPLFHAVLMWPPETVERIAEWDF
jgi:hypothetical protein